MKLLFFEFKKMVFTKKFAIIMVLIIAAVGFSLFRNQTLAPNSAQEKHAKQEGWMLFAYSNHESHSSALRGDSNNEEEKLLRDLNREIINALQEIRNFQVEKDWRDHLVEEITLMESVDDYMSAGGHFSLTERQISHTIAMNQKLLEVDIPPQDERYSLAFPNFMKQVVTFYINLGAIILVILLIGEILTVEFENHSLNLLYTQPIKRQRVMTSKVLTSLILYILTTAVLLGSIVGVGKIFGEEGTFNYPVLIEKNNVIEFIVISDYLKQAFIVLSVSIIMIILLYLLYSLLFKQILSAMFALAGTLLGGYALTRFVSWDTYSWINPFQYLLPEEAILYQNSSTWYAGIPVLLILSAVLYIVLVQKIKSARID